MKYKRFLSAILGICLLNTAAMPKISAEAAKIETSVIYEKTEDKALCYLEGLGIDTSFKGEETVTRGHFTSMLMQLAYNNEFTPSGEQIFGDVSKENEYYKDIYFAYNEKIVSKNDFFRPGDGITYAEAMTMVTTALGYGFIARNSGGYPYGYTKCASDIGLTKNINKSTDDLLSGTDVILLLYNMLDVEFMTQDFSMEGLSYSKSTGSTILTDRYDLTKIKGIVTATVYSELSGASSVKENHIKISGTDYKFDGDSLDLLGMKVVAYVNEDGKAVIVCPESNKVLTAGKVESYSGTSLRVEDGNRSKTVNLDASFCFIYNGAAYTSYTAADFTDFEGYIKLVDNDSDDKYDVVFIYDVEYMKVSQIDKLNKKIYGKTVSRENISFDEDTHIRFYSSGAEIDPITVKIDNILAIMISKDGKVGRVEVTKNELYGTIEQIDAEYVRIDGVDYKRSSHFDKYYSPKAGTTATFMLGILDDVIMLETENSIEYRYGYLFEVKKNHRSNAYALNIFTEEGDFKKYECAEKVVLNGTGIRTAKVWASNAVPLTDSANNTQRQLIKYKVKNGLITAVDTVSDATDLKETINNSNDCLLRYYDHVATHFKADGMNTFLRFNITAQTLLFTIPDTTDTEVEESDFAITEMSALKKDGSYTVDAYDLDDNGIPGVVLIYSNITSSLHDNSEYLIIDRVSDVWTDELGACREVRFWKKGECKAFYLEEANKNLAVKSNGKLLAAGDMVRIVQRNGIIKELVLDFDAETKSMTADGQTIAYGDAAFNKSSARLYASIYMMTGTNLIVSSKKTAGKWDYSLPNLRNVPLTKEANIVVVEDNKVKKIYADEILDYCSAGGSADEMLAVQGYWYAVDVVIYR